LVIIEALASGLKVVVNELDGLKDWLGNVINASGRIQYVKMPHLLGPDTCDPDAAETYIRDLAIAIQHCAETDMPPNQSVERYYSAVEAKSWVQVFTNMECVFRSE